MRVWAASALLWAAAVTSLHLCASQEIPSQVTSSGSILEALDGQLPGMVFPGLDTAGTTQQDVLSVIPAYQGPVRHAVVMPLPPRYSRYAKRHRNKTRPSAASGLATAPGAGPVAAVTDGAVLQAAAPEWKVDMPVPHSLPALDTDTPAQQAAAAAATDDIMVMAAAPPSTYQAVFDRHNYFRSWHGVPVLSWSSTLATSAANYAAKCVWGHDPSNTNQGENLYAYSSTANPAQTLTDAINAWYQEIDYYNYNNPGFSMATGHFTQVVWKGTTQVGCAVQTCPSGFAGWSTGGTYVVCRYSPPGNINSAEYFRANVLPRQANPPPSTPPPPPTPSPQPPPQPPTVPSPRPSPRPSPAPATPSPSPSPPPSIPPGVLPQNYFIQSPGCLVSPNQLYFICMQSDANLVLFNSARKAIWASNTAGFSSNGPMRLVMQADGNLNIFDNGNMLLWSTNTAGRGVAPRRFQVQSDGNALIADASNKAIWVTYTAGM